VIFNGRLKMIKRILFLSVIFLYGCAKIPENVSPVAGFEIKRYLGMWYEIARLDHSFERGLEKVTAEYSIRDDGGVNVVNRGFDAKNNEWKTATGKAYFVNDPGTGFLRVSFFGPFYGSYVIIDLDKKNYSYSIVCGPDRSYLWILSRDPEMPEKVKSDLVEKAKALGFETDKLIYVKH
jgi:apolipoprotein D and lipocalin family protein